MDKFEDKGKSQNAGQEGNMYSAPETVPWMGMPWGANAGTNQGGSWNGNMGADQRMNWGGSMGPGQGMNWEGSMGPGREMNWSGGMGPGQGMNWGGSMGPGQGMNWGGGMVPSNRNPWMGMPRNMMQNPVTFAPYGMSGYPSSYLDEMENERDMQKLKELYPEMARDILRQVEEECDKMEYDGSVMFDEYPDRVMLARVRNSIYDRVKDQYPVEETDDRDEAMVMQQETRRRYPPRKNWLGDMIDVLLYQEMYRRRCRRRNCRRRPW